MPDPRNRVLLAAMVIADAAWLYVALGIIGFFTGQGQSPLPWAGAIGLLVSACLFEWFRRGMRIDAEKVTAVRACVGLAIVYVILAAASIEGRRGFDIGWGVRLVRGDYPGITILGTVIALIAAAYIWRHGLMLSAHESPHRRLALGLRIGIVVFAGALALELASGVRLDTAITLIVFFAASLAGLAIGRLSPGAGFAGTWIRSVASTIIAVLALGVALGLSAGAFGRGGLEFLFTAWGYLSDAIVWAISALLQTVLDGLMALLAWLEETDIVSQSAAGGETQTPPWWQRLAFDPGSPIVETLTELLQVIFLVLLLYPLYRLLTWAYRQTPDYVPMGLGEQHESIKGDARPLSDLARLFRQLLPKWARPDASTSIDWQAPSNEPGISEVFGLYFDLLSAAVQRGHLFVPTQTPLERIPDLLATIPRAPVVPITRRFNAACYGREKTDPRTILNLTRQLQQVVQRSESAPNES